METDLITAAEMRKLAEEAKERLRQDFLNHVKQSIFDAAKRGNTEVLLLDHNNGYYEYVFDHLTPFGFLVEPKLNHILICWREIDNLSK